ncbi:MAG: iron-only hydrogenase system regulator [Ruminococcaceae bacterium]|nr:iron-only hydrogenase system regulator [Oscillospiraceae bacterium]
MDKRLTVLNIVISDREAAAKVNEILHGYSEYVIGRMGLPYGERDVSIICVVLDMPTADASALSGKLGMLQSVTAKVMTPKI